MTARPFWLRPKWVAGHVIAVVLIVLFVNLGFWQLRRLDERRERNALIEARTSEPVRPVQDVIDPFVGSAVDKSVYRRVSARGTYDVDDQVLIRSQSLDGRPGYHVVTPLVTGEGPALVVNRGFVPRTGDGTVPSAPPPPGEVAVEGLLLPDQQRGRLGPHDPAQGELAELARLDLTRLQQQSDTPLYDLYLLLRRQEPPPGELPVLLPELEHDEGPHLGYAAQWFIFAGVGAVGWPLLLRRTAATSTTSATGPATGT